MYLSEYRTSDSNEDLAEFRNAVATIVNDTVFDGVLKNDECKLTQELVKEPTYFQEKYCSSMTDNEALHTTEMNAMLNSEAHLQELSKQMIAGFSVTDWDNKSKKPCNCTKSQCLKLYCDCFANGDFCSNCNCNNCYNNEHHELERLKAIKACLERNPVAFHPKIGKGKTGNIKPRHNKGCNCKRSGCLKNYCECYEAKIMCSSICKCIGCKNYEERPDCNSSMNIPRNSDVVSIIRACTSLELIKATCNCLLAQAEEAEKDKYSAFSSEQMILEEFDSSPTL